MYDDSGAVESAYTITISEKDIIGTGILPNVRQYFIPSFR